MKQKNINFKGIKFRNFSIKKTIFFISSVLVIVVLFFGISYMSENEKVDVKPEIRNVKTQKIKTGSITCEVEYAGELKPVSEVAVFPKTGGKVVSVNVNVGDKVTEGQVLYTLDNVEILANVHAQQAALDGANVDLDKAKTSVEQQISTAKQNIDKLQVQYDNEKDNYDKQQILYNADVISKKDFDEAAAKYDSASIDLKAALDNYELLKNNQGPESIKAAQNAIESRKAALEAVQIQADDATVKAPISGIVSVKDVEVGKLASGQSGSVIIIDNSKLTVEVTVPDKIVGRLKVGQSVTIAVNALDGKKITGTIDTISPNTDSKDKSYMVRINIENSDDNIKCGMFVKVSLEAENKENILVVPNEAIKVENGVNYLYTLENSKIKKIGVETGISNDKSTEIIGNIKADTSIITEGQSLLDDGEEVKVIN